MNCKKMVTLISTCIGTHVTAAGASVGTATAIAQGDIHTQKLAAIDAAH